MAAAFNSAGTVTRVVGATSINYTGITVGSGSNRALVLFMTFGANVSGDTFTATWDSGGTNQTMTLIGKGQENTWSRWSYAWGLIAPTSGNLTLAVSWTTSSDARACAADVTEADQTGGVTTFRNFTTANGNTATPTVSITSASGNIPMACCVNSDGAVTARSNTTIGEGTSGDPPLWSQYDAAASGTTVFTWSMTSNTWGAIGFDIVAAGGGGGGDTGWGLRLAGQRNRHIA